MIEWNRNLSRIYRKNGKRIVHKTYQKPIFLKRELFFYDLFKENQLIKTPEICDFDKFNLKTYFIKTEKKDLFKIVREWAKIHSYFLRNPIEENNLLIQHDIKKVKSYILENTSLFREFDSIVKEKLFFINLSKEIKTLIHGDLQEKNIVTFDGENYYFDFELGGLGHPGRDISSLIISNPSKREEIISTYIENIDFAYPEINKDISSWLIVRTAELYVIFNKKEGTPKQKKDVREKLANTLQEFIL